MIAYPNELPLPRLSGHKVDFANNALRSTFEYAQNQIHIPKDTRKFTFSIIVPHNLKVVFDDFYLSLYDGASPFSTDWLIANETITNARFIGTYSIKNIGTLHEIKANMEIL